jgi:hypothetical protein
MLLAALWKSLSVYDFLGIAMLALNFVIFVVCTRNP